jgi:hypothetical protein
VDAHGLEDDCQCGQIHISKNLGNLRERRVTTGTCPHRLSAFQSESSAPGDVSRGDRSQHPDVSGRTAWPTANNFRQVTDCVMQHDARACRSDILLGEVFMRHL